MEDNSSARVQDGVEVFDLFTGESYYGLNMKIILAEASQQERDAIRAVAQRAHAWRLNHA